MVIRSIREVGQQPILNGHDVQSGVLLLCFAPLSPQQLTFSTRTKYPVIAQCQPRTQTPRKEAVISDGSSSSNSGSMPSFSLPWLPRSTSTTSHASLLELVFPQRVAPPQISSISISFPSLSSPLLSSSNSNPIPPSSPPSPKSVVSLIFALSGSSPYAFKLLASSALYFNNTSPFSS